MSDAAKIPRTKRFWISLVGVSAVDGASIMAAYAFLYGFLRLPRTFDLDINTYGAPLAGFEIAVVLILVVAANLFFLSRLYRFRASDIFSIDRDFGPTYSEIAAGVVSLLVGGLGTVSVIRALTGGVSIFDRGIGHFVALTLSVIVIVYVTGPAIVYGERTLRERANGATGQAGDSV